MLSKQLWRDLDIAKKQLLKHLIGISFFRGEIQSNGKRYGKMVAVSVKMNNFQSKHKHFL